MKEPTNKKMKKLILITHTHRHGVDTHLVEPIGEFSLEQAIKRLGIDYEPDRADESIEWNYTDPVIMGFEPEPLPDEVQECIEAGEHLTSCDDDGFCNACGHQEGAEQEFSVEVCRTGWGSTTLTVTARSQQEANEKALDEAGDHEFSERDAEYTIV